MPNPSQASCDFMRTAWQQEALRIVRQTLNLRQIAVYAEEEAETVQPEGVSDSPIDTDWLTRWRGGAADVSSEELQRLWARLLAGETRQPGSYTLRTIEFLKVLSKQDAVFIASIGSLCIEGNLVRGVGNWAQGTGALERYGLTLGHIIALQHLGVISGAETVFTIKINKDKNPLVTDRLDVGLRCQKKALRVKNEDANASFSISVYPLTQIGIQVLSLGKFDPNIEYLEEIGHAINGLSGYKVTIGDVKDAPDGKSYQLENEVELINEQTVPVQQQA